MPSRSSVALGVNTKGAHSSDSCRFHVTYEQKECIFQSYKKTIIEDIVALNTSS